MKIKLVGSDDDYYDTYKEEKKFYTVEDEGFNIDKSIEFCERLSSNEEFKKAVREDWKESRFDMVYIYEVGKPIDEICEEIEN